ncbi:uncharacterized protein PGTG_08894 [Puccinia graminis f. sp. tritici CRL 75-36-700-3]|uniref:SHSP domain-containing protein n=1 Tax=Puccinia graminis f. sp. tritici (strain CRL 75-36-700-3 / race SCCL) TaxID=418459 RepID=E3KEG5_PUCGT|nr:uncharacterized protein PGTG_08894 [Puccinia graminis f. sp. tritici CRL 75-36-700-3]EFP82698.1 hypothetical protein PGTG_08894 [Puccinia graminis f. sp. tritici CRL 75-36-700-3]
MSFLIAPSQWDDFEQLFDKLVTDRYGPPADGSKAGSESKAVTSGSHQVSKILRPKMDVVETDSSIVVTTELPGAKKEDISRSISRMAVFLSPDKPKPRANTLKEASDAPSPPPSKSSEDLPLMLGQISERSFGSFSRVIAVPQGLTHDQVKAGFKDGVLEVSIPKTVPNKESHNIPIS